jgi:hypothetical protein
MDYSLTMDLLQMMQCSEGCKNVLPIAEFNKPKRSLCKKCVLKKRREAYALKKSIEKSQGGDIFIQTRKCNDASCQKMLPITEFRMTLKKGLRSSCKKCECKKANLRYKMKKSIEKAKEDRIIDDDLQTIQIPLVNGKIDRSGDNDGPQLCAGCNIVRLSTFFRKNKHGQWKSHCSVCEKESNRNRYYK